MSTVLPYAPCCRDAAIDEEALYCGQCRRPLLRCPPCRVLLAPGEHCPLHVAPRLILKAGAPLRSQAGCSLTLPLSLTQDTALPAAALRVKRVVATQGRAEPFEVPLSWDRLAPGRERAFALETAPLEEGGRRTLRLRVVVSAQIAGVSEDYAFGGEIALAVDSRAEASPQQIINVTGGGSVLATGPVTAPSWEDGRSHRNHILDRDAPVDLDRAERFEMDEGIRGYGDRRVRVFPDVQVAWTGFPEGDAPAPGCSPSFLAGAAIRCGRNSRRPDPERNPHPNEVCWRHYGPGGSADNPLTRSISGLHAELFLRNDRFYLRSLGRHGTVHGAAVLPPGATALLAPGDRFGPRTATGVPFQIEVAMDGSGGVVRRISLSRRPPAGR